MKYLFLILTLLTFIQCNISEEKGPSGKVVAISDGDTFTLLTNEKQQIKIRLYGIDTPEKKQPHGTAARQYLSELIFGQQVRYEVKDIDRYKRTIAIVFNESGQNVNEEMIRAGYAWHYKQYSDIPEWDLLEEEARQQKRGLWKDKRPVAPWEWRKRAKEKSLQD